MRVLGHRGTGSGPGENTLAALAEALRLGADGVELDVRRTADGALALCHDASIPGVGAVHELMVKELPEDVPLLEAALDTCAGALVNIEVKNLPGEPGWDPDEVVARQVASLVAERRAYGSVIVSSFSPASLDAVLDADADVPTGLLTVAGRDQAEALRMAADRGYRALHPHHEAVTAELVTAAADLGLGVNVWTVNDPARAVWLRDAGVDALITDRVAEVLAAVGGRSPAR